MINLDDLEYSLVSSMVCCGNMPCEKDYEEFKKSISDINEEEFKGFNKWIVKAVKKIISSTGEAPSMNDVELFFQTNISDKEKREAVIAHMYVDVLTYSPMVFSIFEYYLDKFYKQKALIKLQGV